MAWWGSSTYPADTLKNNILKTLDGLSMQTSDAAQSTWLKRFERDGNLAKPKISWPRDQEDAEYGIHVSKNWTETVFYWDTSGFQFSH